MTTTSLLLDIPYFIKKEEFFKHFMEKFNVFTDKKCNIHIKWITKKIKQLLKLKSRNPHGVVSCRVSYIGETVRNVEIR